MVVGNLAFFCKISIRPFAFAIFLAFKKEDYKSRLVAFVLMIALRFVSLHVVFFGISAKSIGTSVLTYYKIQLSRLSILP